MLFPCGWPKCYRAFPQGENDDEIFAILPGDRGMVVASRRGIQLWSATQNPVKLGQIALTDSDLEEVGLQVAVEWNPTLGSVVSATERGWLLFFSLQYTKQSVFPPGINSNRGNDLKLCQIFPAVCVRLYELGIGTSLVSDSNMLVVGMQDGSLQGYLWRGLLSSVPQGTSWLWDSAEEPPSWFCGCVNPIGIENAVGDEPPQASNSVVYKGSEVVDIDYSPGAQRITLTYEDGSVALCTTADWGLDPLHDLVFRQWVCEPCPNGKSSTRAVCARVGDAVNLVAVGCMDGSVVMYRLSNMPRLSSVGQTPVIRPSVTPPPPQRRITLNDWGHGPDVTGAVQDIKWNRDCTAFAVGYQGHGVAVWTPSGCRLMCSLPQTPLKNVSSIVATNEGPKGLNGETQQGVGSIASDSTEQGKKEVPALQWGVSALAWGDEQYRLWMSQAGNATELWGLKFMQALAGSRRVSHTEQVASKLPVRRLEEVHVLQSDDRILLISEGMENATQSGQLTRTTSFDPYLEGESGPGEGDLTIRHILVPQHYVVENWPVRLTAISPDRGDIAVAGKRGLALFSRRSERWRLFGDVGQEKGVHALALTWLHKIIVVCSDANPVSGGQSDTHTAESNLSSELLLFPRYHLDFSSLLARYSLKDKPVAVDSLDKYILVASQPLDIVVLEVDIEGDLEPSGSPKATLTPVRELSIMTLEHPILNVTLVRAPVNQAERSTFSEPKIPEQCVVLRWGGMMSLLDLEQGVESMLTNDVECFWLSDAARLESHKFASSSGQGNGHVETPTSVEGEVHSGYRSGQASTRVVNFVEMPWWAYGSRGMELFFPSSLAEPLSPRKSTDLSGIGLGPLDPELEFDQEVCPIGISLADAAVIGITQRVVRSSSQSDGGDNKTGMLNLPCFHPMPESQPVLPCLLRRLLQRGAFREAKLLAQRHQEMGLHFSRSLEWLLFTSLEFCAAGKGKSKMLFSLESKDVDENNLLSHVADLVKSFPHHPDVVVSVARKTDAQYWPLLFDAVGEPSKLLETLLRQGGLHSAACLLIVIERLEGEVLARALGLQVLQSALSTGQYDLVADLLKYIISPTEMEVLFPPSPAEPRDSNHTESSHSNGLSNSGYISSLFSWFWSSNSTATDHPRQVEKRWSGLSGPSREAAQSVRDHVWRLLDLGRLRVLIQLATSLGSIGGGLAALMASGLERPMDHRDHGLTPRGLLMALSTAMTEIVCPMDMKSQFEAELLLETCEHARCTAWSVALALMLQHMPVLVGFRVKHPQIWAQFYREICMDQRFIDFVDVVEAVHGKEE